jgi:hypothetical protein
VQRNAKAHDIPDMGNDENCRSGTVKSFSLCCVKNGTAYPHFSIFLENSPEYNIYGKATGVLRSAGVSKTVYFTISSHIW